MATDWDALLERTNQENPEAVKLTEENPRFAGEFLRVEKGHTEYGESLIAILRDPEGNERSLWLFHTALRSGFIKQKPQPGERVAVAYKGKVKGSNGFNYEKYVVVVDREKAPADWDTVAKEYPADDLESPMPAIGPPVAAHNRRDVEEMAFAESNQVAPNPATDW